jgi:ribosomal-protein-alanine N-acetyltransferase
VIGSLVSITAGEEWELENVVVASPFQRIGIASALMAEFIHIASESGANRIHLEVRESNVSARSLYKKFGFVEQGRRASYYSDPSEDALVYSLAL